LQFVAAETRGAQLAFLGNGSGGRVTGFQGALGVNSAGELRGLQLAAVNHVRDGSEGLQAGFVNYAGGPLEGIQGGLFNYAGEKVEGAQLGPSVNFAADVTGAQVGFVNVAQRVEGVQLGLINVADEVHGVPIGLVSVTKEGGVHPLVWYSNITPLNAAVKFATKYTYSFINASWDVDASLVGPGGGLGATIPAFAPRLFVDIDVGATYLFRDSGPADDGRTLARLRGMLRYQFLPHLSVFAGGGYTGQIDRPHDASGAITGDYYYRSLGEFVAGVGL
ncbi:MAG TPA: hypothetical protein VLC09_16505, partial [Polyangiaceae bacterium]|nr:hypothetical protein [Polyangiaceae bacterium]